VRERKDGKNIWNGGIILICVLIMTWM
jgi:hypothetical protein